MTGEAAGDTRDRRDSLLRDFSPTTVRGSLSLPQVSNCLHDISGRKAMNLTPGENGVSSLTPAVYFVHSTLVIRHWERRSS